MSLIAIATDDVLNYSGPMVPAEARLFSSMDWRTSEGVYIAKGSRENPAYYQSFVASMNGHKIRVTGGNAYSTSDALINPGVTLSLVVYDAAGNPIKTVFSGLKIPSSPSPTTWKDIQIYSTAKHPADAPTYLTSQTLLTMFSNLINMATKAALHIFGAVRLSVDPVDLTDPVALGENDPRIPTTDQVNALVRIPLKLKLSSYASLKAAVDANHTAGDPLWEVVVDTPNNAVAENTTVPKNIRLTFEAGGSLLVSSGVTLTIGSMTDPGNIQCLIQQSSTAHIRFGVNAVEKINIAWFLGPTPTLCTNAMNEALASCLANSGGTVYLPQGGWTSAGGHAVSAKLRLFGAGKNATTLTATATNAAMFTHGESIRDVLVRDITLNGNNLSGTTGYLLAGNYPNSSGFIRFENVVIENFANDGVYIHALDGTWQVQALSFDANCMLSGNGHGLRCNSPNTDINCDAFVNVGAGQWGLYLDSVGACRFTGEFGGSTYLGAAQIIQQTIIAPSGCTGNGIATATVTAAGMPNSPVTVNVPLDTTMNTAAKVAQAFRIALGDNPYVASWFHVMSRYVPEYIPETVCLGKVEKAANDGTMNLAISAGTATGITSVATSTLNIAGAADTGQAQGVYIGDFEAHLPITFDGMQEEGFKNFLVCDNSNLTGMVNFDGCVILDPIRGDGLQKVTSWGCQIYDKSFRDAAGVFYEYASHDDTIIDYWYGTDGKAYAIEPSAKRPTNFNGGVGSAIISEDTNHASSRLRRIFQSPIRMFKSLPTFAQVLGEGWLEVLTSRHNDNDDVALRIGSCDDAGTPTYYYDFYRDTITKPGWLQIVANQPQSVYKGANANFAILSTDPGGGIGYGTGAGSVVTQITSKSTAVNFATICGQIVMHNAELAAGASVTFDVNGSYAKATDTINVTPAHATSVTDGAYEAKVHSVGATTFKITVKNLTAGPLSEAVKLNVSIHPSVNL